MLEPDGSFHRVAIAHPDPAKIELAQGIWRMERPSSHDPAGVGEVVGTGQPALIERVSSEAITASTPDAELARLLSSPGLSSAMIIPLRAGDRAIGAITLVSAESRRTPSSAGPRCSGRGR